MMKRKITTDSNYYDFSLSSPATKIRRLDAELSPIIEQVEDEQQLQQEFNNSNNNNNESSIIIEELPTVENPERALVLYSPCNASAAAPVPSLGVSVDSRLISGFKGQYPWLNGFDGFNLPREGFRDGFDEAENRCQAVVPWLPSRSRQEVQKVQAQSETPEFMEAELAGDSSAMDVEDYDVNVGGNGNGFNDFGSASREDQWAQYQQQQQHCMMPQLHQNIATPITWSS